MTLIRNIGKNTLGDNNKMHIRLHNYYMSNHDLSFVFRNTQSPGTLVPFMKIVGQKGDVFDIQLINKTLTHPTVGPLFGSYKLQHYIFSCPIRLYNSWLHNNRTGIGMKMNEIKFPLMNFQGINVVSDGNNYKIDGKPTNPSSLIAYLGYRGTRMALGQDGKGKAFSFNAIPWLAYWDIFKNYFANKQEKNFYWITTGQTVREFTVTAQDGGHKYVINETIRILISASVTILANGSSTGWEQFWGNTLLTLEGTANGKKTVVCKRISNRPKDTNHHARQAERGNRRRKRNTHQNPESKPKRSNPRSRTVGNTRKTERCSAATARKRTIDSKFNRRAEHYGEIGRGQ